MLLPGIALLIDWRTVASGYGDANINNFWIWVLRIGLACISLFIAGYVSLLGEQENLKKDLARQERQQAIQNPAISEEYKLITKRIEDHQRAIAENQLRIQGRAVLVQEKVLKTKLEDKECNGAAGLDEATGVNIAGGHRCGGKATNHRLDAAAAQAQIGEIDTLPAKNDQLKLEITDAEKQREALIAPFLSDPGSMGSLIKSAEYADFGVQVQIFGKLIILMILELFALILAHVVAPQLTVVSNERG
jgi:hypothetical protein